MADTYTSTPNGSDVISNTQSTIQNNFLYLANTLGSAQTFKTGGTGPGDHQISVGGVDSTQFEGRHLSVSFKNQAGALTYPQDGTDSYMWSNAGNIYCGNASTGPFKLTAMTSGANFGGAAAIGGSTNAGWVFLPGGLIMQYGTVATDLGSSVTITYPIAFPSGNPAYSLQITRLHSSSNPGSSFSYWVNTGVSFSSTQFVYNNNDGHTWGFTWVAIGS